MATGVFFHAHPDDEAIGTGGTIAKAKRDGHRVVLIVATNGDEGEPQPGVLHEDESLAERRIAEVYEAAVLLGVDRVVLLGYRDSGMMGDAANAHSDAFWQTDVAQAARRVADVLDEEQADVLVIYDEKGIYGHPDHIQVHRVGVAAAQLAQTHDVFECSPNRDHMREFAERMAESNPEVEPNAAVRFDLDAFGLPEVELTHRVDVGEFLALKRRALGVHASQVSADHPMLSMTDDVFAGFMGVEWFRRRGHRRNGPAFGADLFSW